MVEESCKLINLCSNLVETYNTTILSKAPQVLQQACYNEARLCAEKSLTHDGKTRNVLIQLINNHYNADKPVEEFIGGPVTLTCHWSEEYKKLIYIFGEEHSSKTDCGKFAQKYGILFEQYLKRIITTTDCFLDVFIEIPAYEGREYKTSLESYDIGDFRLHQIGNTFQKCINNLTVNENRNCDLSRIHYFDVRIIEKKEGPDPISNFIFKYLLLVENSEFRLIREEDFVDKLIEFATENCNIMNSFLINPDDNPNFDTFWKSQLIYNKYVVKELEGTYLADLINTFIEKELLSEAKQYNTDLKKYTTFVLTNMIIWPRTKADDLNLITYFEKMIIHVIAPNSRVPDAYTLARIFKKFKIDTDKPEKKRVTDEPEESHNIIIYAGDNHCETYRKFLNEVLNFTPIAKIGNYDHSETSDKPRNCLNMKEADVVNMPFFGPGWSLQPLFSGWPPAQQPGIKNTKKKKPSMCNIMNCMKKSNYEDKRLPYDLSISSSSEEIANKARISIEKNVPLAEEAWKDYLNKSSIQKENRARIADADRNEREENTYWGAGKATTKAYGKKKRTSPY
jgi:hypothetical protein